MDAAAAESAAMPAATVHTEHLEMTLDFDNNLVVYMHHEFVASGLPLEFVGLAYNHHDDVILGNSSRIKYKFIVLCIQINILTDI